MNKIEFGDCREIMRRWASEGIKVQTCVTSPPYFGLRDYGHEGQIGLEQTPEEYIAAMVEVFRCVWDVLADDGTLWLNIGDSYASSGIVSLGGHGGLSAAKEKYDGRPRNPKNDSRMNGTLKSVKRTLSDGVKAKDLIGIPWMLAFALRADGWYLRQDIIWHKPNPMPESVRDRCTKAHEYIFLLSKSDRYFFDSEAMKEPASNAGKRISLGAKSMSRGQATGANVAASGNGLAEFYDVPETRNRRSVWTVTTKPYKGAHFATYPPDLIEPCILAGSREGDIVLDPFMGSGTTAAVSIKHGRQYLGCELNPTYGELQEQRIKESQPEESLQIDMFSNG
jgi:DNA modification methylase